MTMSAAECWWERQYDRLKAENADIKAENAKLRDALKALMMGTYDELCADRGEPQCKECSMRCGNKRCVVTDAMELLRINVFGEPL